MFVVASQYAVGVHSCFVIVSLPQKSPQISFLATPFDLDVVLRC